jgi:hypothetical protein
MARGFPLSPLAQVISDDLRLEKAGPLLDIHTTVNSSWPQIWFRRADGLLKGSFVYKSTEDSFELRKVVAAAHQIPGLPEYERSKLRLTDTDISLYTYDGVANQERLRITSSGNVGIGTSSPSAKTHINNTADQPALRIDSSAGTNALEIYNTEGGQNLIFRVERTTGNVYAAGSFNPGGADVAEYILASEPLEPGDVVELDPHNPKHYRKVREPYSPLVAGVISTAPGFVLGAKLSAERPLPQPLPGTERGALPPSPPSPLPSEGEGSRGVRGLGKGAGGLGLEPGERPLLALLGRVLVKATTESGPIRPGDLLTSASKPGYAMRCVDVTHCEGAIIGKALEALDKGEGVILVLLMR